jgi:GT2 family glycosyltransferase
MHRSFPARPFVSFVLATYNRGTILIDCLQRTLAAALPALGPGHFNIIVVDNASTDNTAALVAALAAEQRHIKLIRLPKNCGPVAKNVALHQNAADILVLLDDDAYPLPGSLAQMVHHFQDDPQLGAAVFDVTLPDGRKEASAYPDVFIGAGTALRGTALRTLTGTRRPGRAGGGLLPADFFMQAEEYDLSFRLLAAGFSVQRFWDMPLMHLKAPGARVGTRTTRLDIRNNLWLLARYLPDPLCSQLAADWLSRYWYMSISRDEPGARAHKAAFLRGAAEGFHHWHAQRSRGTTLLPAETIERIFKFRAIHDRLARAKQKFGLQRIAFGDWGKNLLPFFHAAVSLDLPVIAVLDELAAKNTTFLPSEYRGIPIIHESNLKDLQPNADAIIVTAMSPVHAQRRAAALRRTLKIPVLDLFSFAATPVSSCPAT